MTTHPESAPAHVELMDRIYSVQRYFYDFSRKYYLFGRDRLISQMTVPAGGRVVEVGCGTGRNLMLLARRHSSASFYGVDAANVMIDTAGKKVARGKLGGRIQLRQGMAEELEAAAWFGVAAFDRVVFSYSLSMIPTWREAIEAALANLTPGGELWIVDFWDQAGYPKVFQRVLARWLAMFHVRHRPELLACLHQLEVDGGGVLSLELVGLRYAYLARFVKKS
jgi:S-adenosylmethionine-diacylgycerolhomoserine-N-methlytransferase